ncbi:MAG: flagellin [Myxococcota bacterium]|nr:flagellin [Myxococcota bacterium]
MAIYIHTNMVSISSTRHLAHVERGLESTMDKLSSGRRVNQAADDAAGLAVAENLHANVLGSRQAMRNIETGISMIHVAESGTETTQNLVKRMRELAVMGSSDTLQSTERSYLQDEFNQLVAEVDDLANNTLFGGVHLIDGRNPTLDVQAGVNNTSNDRVTISMGDISVDTIGLNTGTVSLSTATQARLAIDQLDSTLNTLNRYRAQYGASERSLSQALGNMELYSESLQASQSQIIDADYAAESANLSRHQIVKQAGLSILAQGNSLGQGLLGLL